MAKRTHGSLRRLDHVDRKSQVGVSGAMRARDVSRPSDDDIAAAQAQDDDARTERRSTRRRRD